MAYSVQALEVFIASPSDVTKERAVVREELAIWNATYVRARRTVLLPVGWETHSAPELGGRPQQMINDRLLAHADILVGIFWARLGSPTGTAASGTVEEIEKHHAAGKPVMLYFSQRPIEPQILDSDQFAKLNEFKKWAQGEGLIQTYVSEEEFRAQFRDHLPRVLEGNAYLIGIRDAPDNVSRPTVAELPSDAHDLLAAAANGDGTIMRVRTLGGLWIQAGGKHFGEQRDRRTEARWEAALEELEGRGLVQAGNHKRELFRVTHSGYGALD